jgi:hypothetical protein
VAAQTGEVDARLRAMESQLEQFKQRLEALEGSRNPPAPAAPRAQACPDFSELRIGMTEAEVRRHTGEPAKVDASPVWMVWRFPGCGNVHFDVDSRRVVGRSDP